MLLVLPGLAISTFLTWRIFVTARQGADTALLVTARGLDQLVDREFVQAEVLLRTLAATDELKLGQTDEFDRLARATAMPRTSLTLIDAAGRPVIDTGRPAGQHPSALQAAGTSEVAVGEPVISAIGTPDTTGVLAAQIMLPVSLGGRHAYDLALVMPAATMQALLARDPLPAGWTASITDTADTTVASTRELQRYVGEAGPGFRGGAGMAWRAGARGRNGARRDIVGRHAGRGRVQPVGPVRLDGGCRLASPG